MEGTDLLCADLTLISYSEQVALVLIPAPLELSCVHCYYMCFSEEETEPWGSSLLKINSPTNCQRQMRSHVTLTIRGRPSYAKPSSTFVQPKGRDW